MRLNRLFEATIYEQLIQHGKVILDAFTKLGVLSTPEMQVSSRLSEDPILNSFETQVQSRLSL